jgi:hypothetical protein
MSWLLVSMKDAVLGRIWCAIRDVGTVRTSCGLCAFRKHEGMYRTYGARRCVYSQVLDVWKCAMRASHFVADIHI